MTTRFGFDPFKEIEKMINGQFSSPQNAAVPMDLYKDSDTYIAQIDMPGVDPASIDIDIEDRTITVRADRKPVQLNPETGEWISRERSYGTYARRLNVGPGLALDQVEARYDNGVLSLIIPVAEEAKPRKVQVKLAGGESAPRVIEGESAPDGE